MKPTYHKWYGGNDGWLVIVTTKNYIAVGQTNDFKKLDQAFANGTIDKFIDTDSTFKKNKVPFPKKLTYIQGSDEIVLTGHDNKEKEFASSAIKNNSPEIVNYLNTILFQSRPGRVVNLKQYPKLRNKWAFNPFKIAAILSAVITFVYLLSLFMKDDTSVGGKYVILTIFENIPLYIISLVCLGILAIGLLKTILRLRTDKTINEYS